MRVLSLGTLYPPHHLGGYELIWRDAVAHLRRSGHAVRVLATDHREPSAANAEDDDVHRELRWYWSDHRFPRRGPLARVHLERHNAATLAGHLEDFAPDVVSWWPMGGLSLSLVEQVRRAGVPSTAVVCDDWLLYAWRVDAWSRPFFKRPKAGRLAERWTAIPTRFRAEAIDRWVFLSAFLERRAREAGWTLPSAVVAHRGIDRYRFTPAAEREWAWRLLCSGRIDPRKGIDTAIRALALLPEAATLTIHGGGDRRHLRELRALASREGLGERVRFAGPTTHEQMPGRYAEADCVLFPVKWEEPWGLVPLEGMAVGRPVVATATGGSAEYLRDGENCLVFEPRDSPAALAAAVRRVAESPGLRARLRREGLDTVARIDEEAFNRIVERELRQAVGVDRPEGVAAC